ncbi:Bug family tripartite tricarboxylate transporter substrate binding protein [Elioraea rosea]|uniref:Bug family tripartite tricarboxylate transporter substrate binding protein n=1 Tax=Elioraea rosea TaxID=2492390 RepID=UPI0011828174|nr:tripartite tricarboxylate transporter substrate-binding protein [Elioraea rosea]
MTDRIIGRRTVLAAGAALLGAGGAQAQWAPSRPVRLVVPFAPGGLTDILARALADQLQPRLGQAVVVENRAGAGGNLAAEAVARAEPDGHTLLVATQGIIAINKALFRRLPYDPDADFTPLAFMARQPNLLVASPKIVTAPDLAGLIAMAKAAPQPLAYGSNGVGSFTHLSMELFRMKAGIELVHVPYRGSAPMLADLIGGQIALAMDAVATSMPHVSAGTLKAMAVTSAARAPSLPDIPAIAETVPGYDASPWYGVFGPAAAPAPVLARLEADLRAVLDSPAWAALLEQRQAERVPENREALIRALAVEVPAWREAVKASGATAE